MLRFYQDMFLELGKHSKNAIFMRRYGFQNYLIIFIRKDMTLGTNIGCLNMHGAHMTADKSTNNKVVFFFVSDLKIAYYNNY